MVRYGVLQKINNSTEKQKLTELSDKTHFDIIIGNEKLNINFNLNSLIEERKLAYLKNSTDLHNIPNMGGCYWILTNFPINHSFNKEFNNRPPIINVNNINYEVIYNGQASNLRSRIKQHLLNSSDKVSGMSGISVEITTNYKQGTKISHNKIAYTSNTRKKTAYNEITNQKLTLHELNAFKTDETITNYLNLPENNNEQSTLYFKNGINIAEDKYKSFSWLVLYYNMNESIYNDLSNIIETHWRNKNGMPKLCTYKCGR